jgi:hypothetical protein
VYVYQYSYNILSLSSVYCVYAAKVTLMGPTDGFSGLFLVFDE